MKDGGFRFDYPLKRKSEDQDIRCCCGKLLARFSENGVAIRCQRCKRQIVIDFLNSKIKVEDRFKMEKKIG